MRAFRQLKKKKKCASMTGTILFSVVLLYVAWKRGFPRKFARFVPFRLIKKRSFNLVCFGTIEPQFSVAKNTMQISVTRMVLVMSAGCWPSKSRQLSTDSVILQCIFSVLKLFPAFCWWTFTVSYAKALRFRLPGLFAWVFRAQRTNIWIYIVQEH